MIDIGLEVGLAACVAGKLRGINDNALSCRVGRREWKCHPRFWKREACITFGCSCVGGRTVDLIGPNWALCVTSRSELRIEGERRWSRVDELFNISLRCRNKIRRLYRRVVMLAYQLDLESVKVLHAMEVLNVHAMTLSPDRVITVLICSWQVRDAGVDIEPERSREVVIRRLLIQCVFASQLRKQLIGRIRNSSFSTCTIQQVE